MRLICLGEKTSSLLIQTILVLFVDEYKRIARCNLSCVSQNYCYLSTSFRGYGISNYGNGWKKYVIYQCLEFVKMIQSSVVSRYMCDDCQAVLIP